VGRRGERRCVLVSRAVNDACWHRDKSRISVDAQERHGNAAKSLADMKSKIATLQAEVDELNAKDRYGNLATIKSNEKRIAQTKELVEKQEATVAQEAEVAYVSRP
jgi:peptidoglycan hydrolase CwlO-like protein